MQSANAACFSGETAPGTALIAVLRSRPAYPRSIFKFFYFVSVVNDISKVVIYMLKLFKKL